jgi:L-asparaginase
MDQLHIFILYTGGTIGMAPADSNDPSSPLVPKNWAQLTQYMPSIKENGYFSQKDISFSYESFKPLLDSSQVKPEHWLQMARIIEKNYEQYDGFIIIHGTDTMAYTASVLSFFFQNLSKPIVLTGSQLPISHPRTDAVNNFSNSIHIAAARNFGLPTIPEVMICFNDRLLRGNRSSKTSTNDFEGFESPNCAPLGKLEENIAIDVNIICSPPDKDKKFNLAPALNSRVMDVALFPGLDSETLKRLLGDDKVDGLILRTFGAGNAPMDDDFLKVLKEATDSGTLVLNITQCFHGGINMQKYRAGNKLLQSGVISGGDMTKEAALTKMMWVLANVAPENRQEMLCKNLKGELSC